MDPMETIGVIIPGVDNNNDGIGDTPYLIEPNGVDRYPLMSLTPETTPPNDPNGSSGGGGCLISCAKQLV
jgi:hypothetical protein